MCGFPTGLGIWYYRSRKNTQESLKDTKSNQKNSKQSSTSVSVSDKSVSVENGLDKNTARGSEKTAPAVEEDPYKQAQTHKNKGNKLFKEGKYADAIKCYQQAIDVCPKDKIQDVSTFHQNRAAAFEQLVTIPCLI